MSVKSWGKGRPDYYTDTLVSRPVILETQDTWQFDKTYTISAQSNTSDAVYTIPAGYTLTLEGGIISVKDSCINMLQIFAPGSIIGDFRFDVTGEITIPGANQVIAAGTVITAYIYNNDSLTSDFSLILFGVLNEVI